MPMSMPMPMRCAAPHSARLPACALRSAACTVAWRRRRQRASPPPRRAQAAAPSSALLSSLLSSSPPLDGASGMTTLLRYVICMHRKVSHCSSGDVSTALLCRCCPWLASPNPPSSPPTAADRKKRQVTYSKPAIRLPRSEQMTPAMCCQASHRLLVRKCTPRLAPKQPALR